MIVAAKGIKVHRLFPTWVFESRLPGHEELNQRWADLILGAHPTSRDFLLFQTSDTLHELTEFSALRAHIDAGARAALESLEATYEDIVTTGCWANLQRKNSTFSLHSHANSFMSGVYYVRTPANCGSIVFRRRILGEIAPLFKRPNELNEALHRWQPEAGVMLLFPSWLEHYVEQNQSDELRISVSFNLMFRGLLGSSATHTAARFD